jgi:photosystem II stability/assembly factor-like uncharacterized protein
MGRSTFRVASLAAATLLLVGLVGLIGSGPASASHGRSVLPDGFRAQAITFVSPDRGWILGVQTCGQAKCTNVLRTTNGGDTWRKVGRIHAPLTYDKVAGVTEVRFSDDLHGWAFGPSLWSTDDGGATWTKLPVPGGGTLVPVLAADSEVAYAVVSFCGLNEVPSKCDPPTLWTTTPGSGTWTQTSLSMRQGLVTNTARLSLNGQAAYLIVPSESNPDFVRATVDGAHWSPRHDPCDAPDEMLVDVFATSDTGVAFLCISDPGFGHSSKRVFRSNDTGKTSKSFGAIGRDGIVSQLAASPNGRLFMTSWGAPGSWIYRSNAGHAWTEPLALNDGGVGWNDIVMASDQVGFVIHGPAALYPGNRPGELGETTDGGLTWNPV